MLKKLFLFLSLVILSMTGMAQGKYTEYLQRRVAGNGTIVIHHEAEIDNLVNGIVNKIKEAIGGGSTMSGEIVPQEEEGPAVPPSGRHTTANGYRVQIISLGSTAKDKSQAESWGRRFKNYFPTTNVYISFRSPHYVCLVGDFKTREEASELLQQMRETRQFGSASIVRSKINVYY